MEGVVRHLSPSIALRRESPTAIVTVKLKRSDKKPLSFRSLQVPATIEWEWPGRFPSLPPISKAGNRERLGKTGKILDCRVKNARARTTD